MDEKDWIKVFEKCRNKAWRDYKGFMEEGCRDNEIHKHGAYYAYKVFDYLHLILSGIAEKNG